MLLTTEFAKCFSFDLSDDFFPEANWAERIIAHSKEHAETRLLDGSSVTSLDDDEHTYRLVNGDVVRSAFPWLFEMYLNQFAALGGRAFKKDIVCDESVISSININLLDAPDHSYDWHVDANHCTGLLFLNSLEKTSGGALIFRTADGVKRITPVRGKLLFFDAREIPHTIESIGIDCIRATVVMNYNFSDEIIRRPGDLDGYLYK